MQVYGNLETLKEGIKKKYAEMLKAEQKKTEQLKFDIQKDIELQKGNVKRDFEVKAKDKIMTEKSRLINEKKLEAKKDFELTREKLLQEAFLEVEKQAESLLSKKEYINFVKNEIGNKRVDVVTSLPGIKGKLKDVKSVKLDKSVKGIIATTENEVFDFTIDSILEEKRTSIREVLAQELF